MESRIGHNREEDSIVLCVSNQYEKKYYLNEMFMQLPQPVQDELKIIFVMHTEEVGGILTAYFDKDGSLYFETICDPQDYLYDSIGSDLKIKRIQEEKRELWEELEMFYRVFLQDKRK